MKGDDMKVWQDVMRSAVVGTGAQNFVPGSSEEPLLSLMSQLAEGNPEKCLLRANALLANYRVAGVEPSSHAFALPQIAGAEVRSEFSESVAQDLLLMISGEYREALPEWLSLADQKESRVPHRYLAETIDFGRRHPEFREGIVPLLGVRGRWLAAQNPDWKYALKISRTERDKLPGVDVFDPKKANDLWQTGSKEERVALLSSLRKTLPGSARELVESTWSQDSPEERAAFLESYSVSLSMEDEPFLESSLDDKRKEVRTMAQDMLAKLPESRFCLRMIERAKPLLVLVSAETKSKIPFFPKFGAKTTEVLEVNLPTACDKAMLRDGVIAKPPDTTIGERAWWLQQILSRTPLQHWETSWSKTPAEILGIALPEEWSLIVLHGWTSSLNESKRENWAAPLFEKWIDDSSLHIPMNLSWVGLLDRSLLERGVLKLLESVTQTKATANYSIYNSPGSTLLRLDKSIWSVEFTRAVWSVFRNMKGDKSSLGWMMSETSGSVPESLQGEFVSLWREFSKQHAYFETQIERYVELNQFRKEMRRKIAASQER